MKTRMSPHVPASCSGAGCYCESFWPKSSHAWFGLPSQCYLARALAGDLDFGNGIFLFFCCLYPLEISLMSMPAISETPEGIHVPEPPQ